jgi:hypothetical protein
MTRLEALVEARSALRPVHVERAKNDSYRPRASTPTLHRALDGSCRCVNNGAGAPGTSGGSVTLMVVRTCSRSCPRFHTRSGRQQPGIDLDVDVVHVRARARSAYRSPRSAARRCCPGAGPSHRCRARACSRRADAEGLGKLVPRLRASSPRKGNMRAFRLRESGWREDPHTASRESCSYMGSSFRTIRLIPACRFTDLHPRGSSWRRMPAEIRMGHESNFPEPFRSSIPFAESPDSSPRRRDARMIRLHDIRGNAFGPMRPLHVPTSKSGMPHSAMVGTSAPRGCAGSRRARSRAPCRP